MHFDSLVNDRPCCGEYYCLRQQLSIPIDSESLITERINLVAGKVTRSCQSLNSEPALLCRMLFVFASECYLTEAFVARIERDMLAGRPAIEQQKAVAVKSFDRKYPPLCVCYSCCNAPPSSRWRRGDLRCQERDGRKQEGGCAEGHRVGRADAVDHTGKHAKRAGSR